jgi:hypothetical protein
MDEETDFANLLQQALAGEKSLMCGGYILGLSAHGRQAEGYLLFHFIHK